MTNRLMWGLVVAAAIVTLMAGWRWHDSAKQSRAAREASDRAQAALLAAKDRMTTADRREYALEIIGLGVTLDKYRQAKLLDAVTHGHPSASIREQDPKKYPWAREDKRGQEGSRAASSLQNGIGKLPNYWPAPSLYADAADGNVEEPSTQSDPAVGLVASTDQNGLFWTLFVSADFELSERPDRLLERAFAFFDAHLDVPYLVVAAADGLDLRDMSLPKGAEPLVSDGYYVPSMPDSSALFVLARRERVEVIRPFAIDDPDGNGRLLADELNERSLSRRLGLAYDARSKTVQPRLTFTSRRNLTVPEWMALSSQLAKSKDFYPDPTISLYTERIAHPFGGGISRVPTNFKPTPWFPMPWTKRQLSRFDDLPTLGFLHRPIYVKLTDEEGHRLTHRSDRDKALLDGWGRALQTLVEPERKTLRRLITATGGSTARTIELSTLIHAQAEAGGPEFDPSRPAQWINTDARLGNTGAATWFVQIGIGVLASHVDGGVSAAINLRDDKEASIVFVSPPPEETRLKQNAANVLKNDTKPLIDPANYQNP